MKSENQNSILFGDDAKDEVSTALSNLKRVEAPGDFDFRLKARIARSTPQQVRRTGMLLAAKFALPVIVLLGFGAFLIVSNGDTPVSEVVPAVESQAPVVVPSVLNESTVASVTNAAPPVGNAQSNRNSNARPLLGDSVDQPTTDGSSDSALKGADDPLLPRGFDPNVKIDPKSIQSNSQFSVNDLLSMLGVNGEFTSGGFLVRSVFNNSVAARAGVRSGDVIEAINDRPVNAQTVFRGAFSGKSMRVSRDGQRMSFNLGG